jgi:ABC-type nickel/cobalt efflux system permease component RcnA
MFNGPELLLIAGVVGVGVLHTMVPDHWAPIALLARQRGWSTAETARTALQAGSGHVATTLLFGLGVWLVGAAAADSVGKWVDLIAGAALVAFGSWIAIGAWRDLRGPRHHPGHSHDHAGEPDHHHHAHDVHEWANDALYSPMRGATVAERHSHIHRHGKGSAHAHWHDHDTAGAHRLTAELALSPPMHMHLHRTTGRAALLLVLGSSPMVEGIPAFLGAARYGIGLIVVMGLAFAASTIGTYVLLSVYAATGLQRIKFGPVERYGEVLSGAFIAAIGLVFAALAAGPP